MRQRIPWTDRTWTFDFPAELWPEVVERFASAPARAADKTRALSDAALSWRRAEGTWSIKENIGHLLDLEVLLDKRLDEFLAGKDTLTAADMENAATNQATHNERDIRDLLASLRSERGRLIVRLECLQPKDFARTAMHPRLQIPMRLVDAVVFACDHDDYHLATIADLIRECPVS